MQTFLPYNSFEQTAQVLDTVRLNKQRSECKIILLTLLGRYAAEGRRGWPYHPATLMWRGYEHALCTYAIAICREQRERGYEDSLLDFFLHEHKHLEPTGDPYWLGQSQLHQSHRSNLVRKDATYYGPLFPDVDGTLPYYWPPPKEVEDDH